MTLLSHSQCEDATCGLCTGAQTVGIEGRPIRLAPVQTAECLLLVGQSPGVNEDKDGRIFIGQSGQLLEQWYMKYLPSDIDVWATNAVKCIPPYKVDPKVKQIKACNGYLHDDICRLQAAYRRVWVLCLGRIAAHAVLGTKQLNRALAMQGRVVTALPWRPELPQPVTVYSTQHPAALIRNPKDTLADAIKDHLQLCSDGILDCSQPDVAVVRLPVQQFIDAILNCKGRRPLLALDIETYGIRPWRKQTQFHPASSEAIDKVPISEQIVSASFGFWQDDRTIVTTAFFAQQEPVAVERIFQTAAGFCSGLLGTNILFDLGYLSARYPRISQAIETTQLIDLCVMSFIQNPDRPELSLKALAPLLLRQDVSKYESRGTKYADDRALLEYNRQDVVNPLLLHRVLLRRMKSAQLPPDPVKLIRYYSDVLHALLHMAQVGVCFDQSGMAKMYLQWHRRVEQFEQRGFLFRGIRLNGVGSQKDCRELFDRAVEAGKNQPIEWELSETKGLVLTSKGNMRRALAIRGLPLRVRKQLLSVKHYRSAKKLVSSYLLPMLELVSYSPIVHPTWFPVPSRFEDDAEGGTRQGRITCKHPALQTAPAEIKSLMRSRYPRGVLLSFDYSQLELRILALMSGDPALMRVYENDLDLHQETLEAVLGRPVSHNEPHYERLRRQAKYTNFGVVYGISAPGLREAWWRYAGIDATEDQAALFITAFKRKFQQVPVLHSTLIHQVQRDGHLVLPVTGHWLSFADPNASGMLDKAILNYPIQAMAATLCLVAQHSVIHLLRARRWGVSPLNVYDAIHVDARDRAFEHELRRLVVERMTTNWYYEALCGHFGRRVPLKVDCKVLSA